MTTKQSSSLSGVNESLLSKQSNATISAALAAPSLDGVELVSARPDRIELRVPGDLQAVATAGLAPSTPANPRKIQDTVPALH